VRGAHVAAVAPAESLPDGQAEATAWGTEIRSCCSGVFVDEAAEALAALELADRSWVDEVETTRWCGRFQFDSRPVRVVVLDVHARAVLGS
jgi:hypothetical protein